MVFNINLSQWFNRPDPAPATTTAWATDAEPAHESTALAIVGEISQSVGSALVAVQTGALVSVGEHVANTIGTALATLGTRELSVLGTDMATEIKPIGTELIVVGSECTLFNDSIIQGATTLFSSILDDEGYRDLMFFLIALVLLTIESRT